MRKIVWFVDSPMWWFFWCGANAANALAMLLKGEWPALISIAISVFCWWCGMRSMDQIVMKSISVGVAIDSMLGKAIEDLIKQAGEKK